jgi:hypothetical protein
MIRIPFIRRDWSSCGMNFARAYISRKCPHRNQSLVTGVEVLQRKVGKRCAVNTDPLLLETILNEVIPMQPHEDIRVR